jgi:hypothetical protein
MTAKKGSKSAGKKTPFIFGRDTSVDDIVKAIKKICDEAGLEFVPARKLRKRKK